MKRILFVDDEPSVLTAVCNSLRSRRHEWEAILAFGADDALDELGRGSFDVIVSDLHMPGFGGEALLRKLRDDYPHMKRIVLTGDPTPAMARKMEQLAHRYLEKPCSSEDLQRAIEQVTAAA